MEAIDYETLTDQGLNWRGFCVPLGDFYMGKCDTLKKVNQFAHLSNGWQLFRGNDRDESRISPLCHRDQSSFYHG